MQPRYTNKNAAPPYSPVIYGNFHIFPRPIADPAAAAITPNLLVKSSLFALLPFAIIKNAMPIVLKNKAGNIKIFSDFVKTI